MVSIDELAFLTGCELQARQRPLPIQVDRSLDSKLIDADTSYWLANETIPMEMIRRSRYADASRFFMQSVEMMGVRRDGGVARANLAFAAGSRLYRTGAYREALPLYIVAAQLNTGGGSSLASAQRLALLTGDWRLATDLSQRQALDENSIYAYRDYLSLLHFRGRSDEAWSLFGALLGNPHLKGAELWTSTYLGHRMAAASHAEVLTWTGEQLGRCTAEQPECLALTRYLFLASVTDRLPPLDLDSSIRAVDPRFERKPHIADEVELDEDTWLSTPLVDDHHRIELAARGLAALHRGQAADAFAALDLIGPTSRMAEFLPYYAWSAFLSGKTQRIDKYIEMTEHNKESLTRSGQEYGAYEFDRNLAKAFLAGGRGELDGSMRYLRDAVNRRPYTADRLLFTYYQVIETAAMLYQYTGEEAYRAFGFDLAHRYQIIQPMYPWAYAFAALLATPGEQRITYLATAMHLDPNSWRVSLLSAGERNDATRWLASNGPMYQVGSDVVQDTRKPVSDRRVR